MELTPKVRKNFWSQLLSIYPAFSNFYSVSFMQADSYKRSKALRNLFELTVIEICIEPILGNQFLMGTTFDDVAIFEYEN